MEFYRYLEKMPSGRRGQMLSTEHMLYLWEAAEALEVDEGVLGSELADICRGTSEYYYVTRNGERLRCYRLKDVMEAALRIMNRNCKLSII